MATTGNITTTRPMGDKKMVVVVGARGHQGGSVVKALLADDAYSVRGITRDTNSETSRALQSKGVDMVQANIDNVESLISAFEGAYAVFGVTDFAEQLRNYGPDAAEEAEYQQAVNLAKAAAATESLQHYIWSTIPSAWSVSSGRIRVPHFESKARADEYILRYLPNLGRRTTFLWVGYYPSNIKAPAMAPTFHASSGKDVWLSPVTARTELLSIGSQQHNVGVFALAILDQPLLTLPAKYVMAEVDHTSLGEVIDTYAELTGRTIKFIHISLHDFNDLFPGWDAIAKMLSFWEIFGRRSFAKLGVVPLTSQDLSIDPASLVSTKEALRMLA